MAVSVVPIVFLFTTSHPALYAAAVFVVARTVVATVLLLTHKPRAV